MSRFTVLVAGALVVLCGCASSSATGPATSATAGGSTTRSTASGTPPSTTPPSTAAPLDPCVYLSAADVGRAFGTSGFAEGRRVKGAGWIIAQCEWIGSDSSVGLAMGSTASLGANWAGVGMAGYFAARRTAEAKQVTEVDLPGVGDGGYVISSPAPTALVFKGDVLVQVTTYSKAGAVDVKVASSLAARVLERATR